MNRATILKSNVVAAAAIAIVGLTAGQASAAVDVLNLSGVVADGSSSSSTSGGQVSQFYNLDLGFGAYSPLLLSQGDELQVTINLDGPLTVPAGTGTSGYHYQYVTVGFQNTDNSDPGVGPNTNTIGGYDVFSGGAGIGSGQMGASCGNCLAAVFGQEGPSFSFTSLFSDTTINQLDTPYVINDVSLSLYVVNDAVPEPASWALMLLGFGGLGALARGRRGRAYV